MSQVALPLYPEEELIPDIARGLADSGSPVIAKFLKNVEHLPAGHQRWLGRSYQTYGEGYFRWSQDGREFIMRARRFAWWQRSGSKPNGVLVRTCDFKGCIAPEHLRLVPYLDFDGLIMAPTAGEHEFWIGYIDKKGYGKFWDGQSRPAHVIAWERRHGCPIPDGMGLSNVRDICGHKHCLNLDHWRLQPKLTAFLAAGTSTRFQDGQLRKPEERARAEAHLTANPELSNRVIAEQAGVNVNVVRAARKRMEVAGVIHVATRRIGKNGSVRNPRLGDLPDVWKEAIRAGCNKDSEHRQATTDAIRSALLLNPNQPSYQLASACGVRCAVVDAIRDKMEGEGTIPRVDYVIGKNGQKYARRTELPTVHLGEPNG